MAPMALAHLGLRQQLLWTWHGLWRLNAWVHIPAVPLISCVALSKHPNLSERLLPHW